MNRESACLSIMECRGWSWDVSINESPEFGSIHYFSDSHVLWSTESYAIRISKPQTLLNSMMNQWDAFWNISFPLVCYGKAFHWPKRWMRLHWFQRDHTKVAIGFSHKHHKLDYRMLSGKFWKLQLFDICKTVHFSEKDVNTSSILREIRLVKFNICWGVFLDI